MANDWTGEQRRLLVECAYHMTEITGHDIHEATVELARLIREFKKMKADEADGQGE